MSGELKMKRVYLPLSLEDGWRVLIYRLWPRGVSKERAALDAWRKESAPSLELRKWFGHAKERFDAFTASCRAELSRSVPAAGFAAECREKLRTQNVTLLYAAKCATCNHAVIRLDWLREKYGIG